MATKKNALTAEAVTDNLRRLFPGKQIECTQVVVNYNGTILEERYYYIQTESTTVVVTPQKMIWCKPTIKQWSDYLIYCNDGYAMYRKERFADLGTCIPFIYIKSRRRYGQEQTIHEQAELLLMACGLKAEPKPKSVLDRLKEIDIRIYFDAYKLFSSVKVISACFTFDTMQDSYGWAKTKENLFCCVTTETGYYRFAIEHENEDIANEIRGIFRDLLGITVCLNKKEKQPAVNAT